MKTPISKPIFLVFHTLTMISAITAAIMFAIFYTRQYEAINLVLLIPALIVAVILILNSYSMYHGRYDTRYFKAMKIITTISAVFAFLCFFVFGSAFGGSSGEILSELFFRIPMSFFSEPLAALTYEFPIFAIGTVISSFVMNSKFELPPP
jgi:hypothetical protein